MKMAVAAAKMVTPPISPSRAVDAVVCANDMPSLELGIQRYPEVRVDGQPVAIKLKRGLALLALLSEFGRKVARAQLIDLLWPDATAEIGRARLRRLAHEVNQVLGMNAVAGDHDSLWLSGGAASLPSDVERVRRAARQLVADPTHPQSRASVELLLAAGAHQILDGFDLGVETFDAWLSRRRAEQQQLVARALQRAAEQLLAVGQAVLAEEAASRLTTLEPLADSGHALLLAALAQRGDLAAVEGRYFAFAELLRSELGVRPSPTFELSYAEARRAAAADAPVLTERPPSGAPRIRFADTSDGAVAYLELGSGPQTLVILFGLWSHVEVSWEEPTIRSILLRLAQRYRVVLMDRRGTGVSERLVLDPSVPAGVEDLDAVRRTLGVDRLWLFGNSAGGLIAIEYAATHPDAVEGLVLYATSAKGCWSPDFPWAPTAEQFDTWAARLQSGWGGATSLEKFAPSQASDPVAQDWWARLLRQAMSRNSLPTLLREASRMDVRHRLAQLRVPTLVLQREGDRVVRPEIPRYLAQHIPGARLTMLPGDDHNLWAGDVGSVLDRVEAFIASSAERHSRP